LYESFTGNIGTTIRYEYLPEDVVPRLYLSEAVVDGAGSPIAEGGLPLQAKLISRQSNHQVWQVALPDGPASVAFPLNWWPDWDATVDGVPTACTPMPGSGRASVVLPSGEHAVTLTLHPTPLRRLATWLSAVTAVVSLLAVGAPTVRGQASPSRPRLPRLARAVALALVLAVASLAGPLLGRQATESAAPAVTPAATFFDFSQMPYPHQGPIDFGIAELAAVEFGSQHSSGRTARPGDTIDVVLSWSKLPTTPLTATLSVVSPAQPRHNVDYTLTRITMPVEMTTRMQIELPLDLARGLYLLHLRLRSPAGVLTAHTARGRTMGELFVGALRIPEGAPLAPDTTVVAVYRDLILHDVEVWQETATDLAVRLSWSTQGTPRNWRLSLRVLDATGRLVTQQDHQPGYGYLPTTLWHPGELVVDTARLQIPEGQAPGDYTLRIITYLQATGEGGGEHDSPIQLTTPTLYDIREACCEQTRKGATILCQTPEVALLTVLAPDSIAEGDDLTLQAEWNALLAPARDLSARWQVTAPDGKTVAEVEQPLARGSRSSEWPRFAWVLAHVDLDLPDQLDAGPYNLALTLTDAEGDVKACGVVGDLAILPHPRVFELPDLPTAQTARFGGIVQLLGYETVLDRRNRTLDLTIWWQATASPRADFKRFVHLYDPATESILAQDDAMPRDWQYPTSWWAAGEIVSETIALDIAGIPSGSYRLGIGWYEPTTVTRLPATLADGTPAPAGRVTLEQSVVLRPGDRLRWPWSRP
ncbi:MAG: hypothetical protein JXC32_17100, partial [Anaerolineae bacterium]|nr:hypothetical protein [Anaerolineae bacterium]